ATTYFVRSELATGCYDTDTILISIDTLPSVNAGVAQSICIGNSFDLASIATGSGTLTYHTSQANAD
ncbi:hypothetical protein, partial [uncultured Algibacter sp.]|uniref:hypothetical protein n=1 Tax=uncultured Algibacter sp. TaxID=298659 RepID=UPI002608F210